MDKSILQNYVRQKTSSSYAIYINLPDSLYYWIVHGRSIVWRHGCRCWAGVQDVPLAQRKIFVTFSSLKS